MTSERSHLAWSLTCGGLGLLVARQVLALVGITASVDQLGFAVGAVAGYALLGAGVWLTLRHSPQPLVSQTFAPRTPAPPPPVPVESIDESDASIEAALDWLARHDDADELWRPFDQLVRELLAQRVGAERVRVWRCESDAMHLCALATGQSERCDGILGHVAVTGRDYFAHDPDCGELVRELAAGSAEKFEWVFPVLDDAEVVGVVAAGRVPTNRATAPRRAAARRLVTLLWLLAQRSEQLRVSRITDKASGMLTRSDFFVEAERAARESIALNEPTVAAVIAIEGLRRLDDTGRWHERDEIVEAISRTLVSRLRAEDVAGRFSDDRFVLLLRRLDAGLGKLVVEKFVSAVQDTLARRAPAHSIAVRSALAGGSRPMGLEQAFTEAFSTLDARRREAMLLPGEAP